jgi:hypothetical protein
MSRFIIKAELAKTEKLAHEIQEAALLYLVKQGIIPEAALPINALETLEYRSMLFKQA